jgi:hypothetical protein
MDWLALMHPSSAEFRENSQLSLYFWLEIESRFDARTAPRSRHVAERVGCADWCYKWKDMEERGDEFHRMRIKLAGLVLLAAFGELGVGYYFSRMQPPNEVLSLVFIFAGLASFLVGMAYLYFLPGFRKSALRLLLNDGESLSDVLESSIERNGFQWPVDEAIVGRDWSIFLPHSSLEINGESFDVFAEQPAIVHGQRIVIAYVRCESGTQRHFDGWILHARDIDEGKAFKVENVRPSGLAAASPMSIARATLSIPPQSLPVRYQILYRDFVQADPIVRVMLSGGPDGLLVAVEPAESEHEAALESALEAFLTFARRK